MSDNIERAAQEVIRLNETDGPVMNERTFVVNWLLTLRAYIAGEPISIALWLNENKISVFTEVSIVDNAGNEVFKVPSLFIKQDKILPNSVAKNMSDIMYRAENLGKTIPGKGNVYIRGEITEQLVPRTERPEYEKRWDAIFTRYDLEPVFSTTQSNSSVSVDEGFDDHDEL